MAMALAVTACQMSQARDKTWPSAHQTGWCANICPKMRKPSVRLLLTDRQRVTEIRVGPLISVKDIQLEASAVLLRPHQKSVQFPVSRPTHFLDIIEFLLPNIPPLFQLVALLLQSWACAHRPLTQTRMSGLKKSAAIRPFATEKSRLAREKIFLVDSLATESCRLAEKWRLFIFISWESKWGTLKSAGNPTEMRSSCRNSLDLHWSPWPQPGRESASVPHLRYLSVSRHFNE